MGVPEARAQDEARAAWLVTRFDITISAPPTDRALSARAILRARNVGRGAGQTLSLRLSARAEVRTTSVGDANATFRTAPESRGNLQRVTINLPAPVAPDGVVNVAMDYRFPVEENNGLAAISPVGTQFLPLSSWYPAANTQFAVRGADSAPYRLTVNGAAGEMVLSSGKATGNTFEQTLNAQPFFLTGDWEVASGAGESAGISAWLPKGAGADERKQAEALMALASGARAFYAGLLGPAPDSPIRLVAVDRGAGFNEGGTALLDAAAFHRTKIDSSTALLISESVARLWLGGATVIRGEGYGALREGLSRFLASLFIEKQYGAETAEAERMRERAAYTAIARREAPLSLTTLLDDSYFTTVTNKGAMIWRLVDRSLGRDAFMEILRAQLQAGAREQSVGLTLANLRAAISEKGGAAVKTILDQGLDQPTDIDLMVGLPQQRGGQWVSALRNTGSLEVAVTVVATTERGERVATTATIPARDFGEAVFKTAARLVRVEVDPDKYYPQLDYANDVVPRKDLSEDALAEATRAFVRQEYARAESITRELLSVAPRMQEARILLARTLLGQNKLDEAEREFRALLDERLPTPLALAWANNGLGEIAVRRGQAAEAARRFNDAVRADGEYASTLAARLSRIKAEAAGGAAPALDDAAQKFVAQLDQSIRSGRRAELDTQLVPGELVSFAKGIVGSQPEAWQTRVLRTEMLDANHLAADVTINARQFGRDLSGTAVLILARVGGSWKLADIQLFEVR
ncbi:MAG TPA: tetratricopeptide repeat protein [Pyrinomonadaceae bacterium]|jgi:Tfp pilus assembly protein PilF|nr:tetratricopeptide repeat protein [Pyrinomonadaceae bacterium]